MTRSTLNKTLVEKGLAKPENVSNSSIKKSFFNSCFENKETNQFITKNLFYNFQPMLVIANITTVLISMVYELK